MFGERIRVVGVSERVEQLRRALDIGEEERDGAGGQIEPGHGRARIRSGSWIGEGDGERRGVPGRHAGRAGAGLPQPRHALEGLRYDVTPPGMHYLVIHFDIPPADEAAWTVEVDGLVERALSLSVDDLRRGRRSRVP